MAEAEPGSVYATPAGSQDQQRSGSQPIPPTGTVHSCVMRIAPPPPPPSQRAAGEAVLPYTCAFRTLYRAGCEVHDAFLHSLHRSLQDSVGLHG